MRVVFLNTTFLFLICFTNNLFAQEGILNAGTVIRVKFENEVLSNKQNISKVTVDQDVKDSEGNILIETGSLVEVAVKRKNRKVKGDGGEIEIQFLSTAATDGQLINLNDSYKITGDSREKIVETVTCISCFVAFPLNFLFLLIPGKHAVIPENTPVNVRVASSYTISIRKSKETKIYEDDFKDQTLRGGGDPLKGLNVSPAKEMKIGNYYTLIIGIDNYVGEWEPLTNAVSDARSISEVLRTKYKIDNTIELFDMDATRTNIIKQLEWLVENVKPEDNVFIYYSGHGEFKFELNKGFWVPVDAKTKSISEYISNNDLQTFLGGIKSKHTLLISDACFSGDLFRGHTVSVPFENSERYFNMVHNLSSRQAITSGGIEPVMDGGQEGHSVFTYYLLKTLKENNEKFFDASQLYSTIKIPVINNSRQTPKFQSIKDAGDEGGQYIFILK